MHGILAIDAGGTTTRAVIVDRSGRCRGFGLAGGGNPVSAGLDSALVSLVRATEMALRSSHPRTDALSSALIAMAGASTRMPREQIADRFAALGLHGNLEIESDLLAMFRSGTIRPRGYTLVAGTGAVAARIMDDRLEAVCDGVGWLLGDAGSGFWIGRRVVRAVVAALDGRAPETALTGLLLAALRLEATSERADGRPLSLLQIMDALYAARPIELSRFAPLAFQAQDDPVASGIVTAAASALAGTLGAVRSPGADGPVVLGGSILGSGMPADSMPADSMPADSMPADMAPAPFAASLKAALGDAEVIPVHDGLVGAAVLGLQRAGVRVDGTIFDRIGRDVTLLRDAAAPLPETATSGNTPGKAGNA